MKQVTLNPEEEREFEKLNKLGQRLHVPIPQAIWKLEVFLKGNLIQSYEARCHSWTRNAYNVIYSQIAGSKPNDATFEAGKLSQKTTAGNILSGDYPMGLYMPRAGGAPYCEPLGDELGYHAVAAEDAWGILVGSGTNVESFEDYVLQTPIAEGAGGDQLNHVTSEAAVRSYAAPVLKDELIRYFNNNSGGNVLVNEVALVAQAPRNNQPSSAVSVLVTRDKLASTVTIPNTGQLKVTYTISLTYPS